MTEEQMNERNERLQQTIIFLDNRIALLGKALKDFIALLPPDRWTLLRPTTITTITTLEEDEGRDY